MFNQIQVSLGLLAVLAFTGIPSPVNGQQAEPAKAEPSTSDFEQLDSDKDGSLSLNELLAGRPENQKARSKRDFGVVDWDQNGRLSRDEFLALPGVVPLEKRSTIPDPVADAVTALLDDLKEKWPDWDLNSNGALDPVEFTASQMAKSIPGLEDTEFSTWDQDGNKRISRDEVVRVISFAGGLAGADGFVLRKPNGTLFWSMLFVYLDVDKDGFLSAADLNQRKFLEGAAAEEKIKQLDKNEDQKLSPEESRPIIETDVLGQFLAMDLNLNGQLDHEEWIKATPDWRSHIAEPTFQAFDTDTNQQLSFAEYRWTPVANPLAAWNELRVDADGNGTLEPSEFVWQDSPSLRWLSAMMFQRYDRRQDDHLDCGEFYFRTTRPNAQLSFAREDLDADGRLSLQEHLFGLEMHELDVGKRDFRLFDFDQDQFWSMDEYRANPRHAVLSERGPVPDPLVRQVDGLFEKLKAKLTAADTDQNGSLNATEFAAAQLGTVVYGLADVPFAVWDLNKDGKLPSDEARVALRVAFGLSRPDGNSLRWDNGVVVNWMAFKVLDRNGDDKLDEEECVKLGFDGPLGQERFQQGDTDHDGAISFVEWKQQTLRHPDILSAFLTADADLDGLLTPDELKKATPEFQQVLLRHLFPGFDADQDGRLSLDEYRLSPLGNFQEPWHIPRVDLNEDGALSLAEFTWDRPLDSRALCAQFFGQLDTSKDQALDTDEFFFNSSRRDLEREFKSLDKNQDGTLSEAEYLTATHQKTTRVDFLAIDFNGDGRLSRDEYLQSAPQVAGTGAKSKVADQLFQGLDADKDGNLSLEEFLSVQAADLKGVAQRNFEVVDWDKNSKLSRDEFLALPGIVPLEQRPRIPDPIQAAVNAVQTELKSKWSSWDRNSDEVLDQAEFTASQLAKLAPGLDGIAFEAWDRDHNGKITRDEAVDVVAIAGGLTATNGLALRNANGTVFWWGLFIYLDADLDGLLSASDLQQRSNLTPEVAQRRIAILDRNQDQKLSADESRPLTDMDVLGQFLAMDLNVDGQLDRGEWIKATPEWRSNIAVVSFQAFDTNHDERLSFREYRWTPVANPLAAWHDLRLDTDGNGTLEPGEFVWLDSPSLRWLSAALFQRLDRHQDGHLDAGEFVFRSAHPNPPLAFAREDLDGDGRLTLDEHLFAVEMHERTIGKRDFRLFDFDQDQFWSIDEYRANPRHAVLSERGPVPDPLVRQVDGLLEKLKTKLTAADADQNGSLNATEFAAAPLGAMVYGLADVPFEVWDLNKDGTLPLDEAQLALRVAFGLARSDGNALRWDNGVVVNWMAFKALDRNGDDKLDEEECVKFGFDGPQGPERFQQGDTDHDGAISFVEWKQHALRHPDILSAFLTTDSDLDCLLSPEELQKATPEYQQVLLRNLFPAFDADQDGRLNLEEFRLSPLGNFQEPWHIPRPDRDGDGLLSLAEFTWERPLDSRAISAQFFRQLDTSNDQALDTDEFFFSTSYRNPEREFKKLDKNGDGQLNEAEFVANSEPKSAKRDFAVFDADANGQLTYREYLTIASRTPAEWRLAPPDPVTALAATQRSPLEAKFAAADQDGDGALNVSEFQKGGVVRDVPGLQLTRHKDWDCDHNGTVSLAEIQKVIDAAYGVRRLDGAPFREPSGLIHNAMLYTHVDANHDDQISKEEYLERGFGGPAASETFRAADTDNNGTLSFQEWSAGPNWQIDPIAEFLRFDTDFDGRLSKQEIHAGVPEWMQQIADTYIPAFDTNKDGVLNLEEYRLVPMVNLLTTWQNLGVDRDGDGKLSFSEFHTLPGIELLGLANEYFRRWDTNANGKLELTERRFYVDPTRVTADIAFLYRDTNKDSYLTLEELLVDLKAQKSSRETQTLMGKIEEAFRAADTDGDKRLSFAEFDTEMGQQTVKPKDGPLNTASATIARNPVSEGGTQLLAFVAVNILLIGGAAWYVLFKK